GNIEGASEINQSANVLGKTTAAITGAGKKELEADALVVADAAADLIDVGPEAFAQVGHFVDEADLGGQHGVGDILGHLGAFRRHDEKRVFGAEKRGIQLLEQRSELGPAHADDD